MHIKKSVAALVSAGLIITAAPVATAAEAVDDQQSSVQEALSSTGELILTTVGSVVALGVFIWLMQELQYMVYPWYRPGYQG